MSAIDEILQAKHAFPSAGSIAKGFGGALVTGAGAGAAGAVMTGAGMAASKLYDAVSKARDFKTMLGSSFNADLQEHYQQRPKQFNEAYSSLRLVNPSVTRDPMTAGHFMRRIMENADSSAGGIILGSLPESKEISKASPFDAFQRTGTQAAGSSMADHFKGRKGRPQEREPEGD